MLEQSPASASGYLTLADYYFDSGDTARAIADYEHTLELAPARADVHDSLAMAYYKQGARAEAIAEWKQVFSTLAATGQQRTRAREFLDRFLADLRTPAQQKTLQRSEAGRRRSSARLPPPQRQLPLQRSAA